jgi:hypothetical protein
MFCTISPDGFFNVIVKFVKDDKGVGEYFLPHPPATLYSIYFEEFL